MFWACCICDGVFSQKGDGTNLCESYAEQGDLSSNMKQARYDESMPSAAPCCFE